MSNVKIRLDVFFFISDTDLIIPTRLREVY